LIFSSILEMYNIIPLILICVSIFIIIVIVVRKFPALANLDVENIPAEREARFKEQIVTSRLQKSLAKWKVRLGKFFGFFGRKIGQLFSWLMRKLTEAKKSHSQSQQPLSAADREKAIKELAMNNLNLDDRENFEDKEKNLIKVIELNPRQADAFISLGKLYAANRKNEEAKQALAHALKILGEADVEKQAGIYYDLAEIYRETGEDEEALSTVKMAVQLAANPRYLDSLLEISIINKDKNSAQEAWEKLAAVNPENGKLAEYKELIESIE